MKRRPFLSLFLFLPKQFPITGEKCGLALRREWKSGDVIEYTIDQPMHLEAVDSQHPGTLALMRGALTLFAINSPESRFTREQLLAAKQSADGRSWKAESAKAPVGFKAFPDIRDEHYRLYHEVTA